MGVFDLHSPDASECQKSLSESSLKKDGDLHRHVTGTCQHCRIDYQYENSCICNGTKTTLSVTALSRYASKLLKRCLPALDSSGHAGIYLKVGQTEVSESIHDKLYTIEVLHTSFLLSQAGPYEKLTKV